MARIRTLKPGFFRSRSLARCSRDSRLTFQGLWVEADDYGRGIADSRILKGSIWPLDDDITPSVVEGHLRELEATGHISLYTIEGEDFYVITAWEEHQAAAYRRGPSTHPAPPEKADEQGSHDETCKKVQLARSDVQESAGREGKGREKGSDGSERPDPLFGFEDFWNSYPKRNGKRLGRSESETLWKKLLLPDKQQAATGAKHYFAAVEADLTIAKDPKRWLAGRCWDDWQEPARPKTPTTRFTAGAQVTYI